MPLFSEADLWLLLHPHIFVVGRLYFSTCILALWCRNLLSNLALYLLSLITSRLYYLTRRHHEHKTMDTNKYSNKWSLKENSHAEIFKALSLCIFLRKDNTYQTNLLPLHCHSSLHQQHFPNYLGNEIVQSWEKSLKQLDFSTPCRLLQWKKLVCVYLETDFF